MNRFVPLAFVLGGVAGALLTHSTLEPVATRLAALLCLLASLLLVLLVLVALLRRLPRLALIVVGLVALPLALRAIFFAVAYRAFLPELAILGLGVGVLAFWPASLPRLRSGTKRLLLGAGVFGLVLGIQWSVLPTRSLLHGLRHNFTPLGLLTYSGLLLGPFALALLSSSSGSDETARS
ncbi:hypothetical protein [Armatimonas rosea]|uniref:Uncharacterized protein n=1 Tax=Armatimonas rosea TaxID=685828 RepID=A0A7W9SUH6_ARMRO|nr:hypothetical protein [Armatimonas rosea]MBB6053077.1 hypothetical protein [Armatimonas rosea]